MVVGGALCLVAMTGLDQDMMQRNMSCRSVRESQVNVVLTALCQIVVIALFLVLGVLLYRYMEFAQMQMPESGDEVFAMVATHGSLPLIVGVIFIAGLISSTCSSAGSALTALTTSFTLDIMPKSAQQNEKALRRLRERVHIVMALVMVVAILLFDVINDDGVINLIFRIAGYTYGPILGLFVFGMVTKRRVNERFVPIISIVAPLASYALQWALARYCDYHIGFELLGYNALFVIFGLAFVSHKAK
jgi:Na+/proline symporter